MSHAYACCGTNTTHAGGLSRSTVCWMTTGCSPCPMGSASSLPTTSTSFLSAIGEGLGCSFLRGWVCSFLSALGEGLGCSVCGKRQLPFLSALSILSDRLNSRVRGEVLDLHGGSSLSRHSCHVSILSCVHPIMCPQLSCVHPIMCPVGALQQPYRCQKLQDGQSVGTACVEWVCADVSLF